MKLRDYQERGVAAGVAALMSGERTLFISPTGTGKSYMMKRINDAFRNDGTYVIAPSVEILSGLIEKGLDNYQCLTPLGLLNSLRAKHRKRSDIKRLIVDEAHHDAANTYAELYAELQGVPRIGFTATPYRMRPQDTAAFLANWDKSVELLSWLEAQEKGFISIPDVYTVPLVDDDLLKISKGEFSIQELEQVTANVMEDLLAKLHDYGFFDRKRIACVTMPSVGALSIFHSLAPSDSVQVITAKTHPGARRNIIANVRAARTLLGQINIMGEGVDIPVRLMADASPTLSPVRFVQRFGRACRPLQPGEAKGVYLCFNRNVQHHGYLLRDILPVQQVAQAQEAFGNYSARSGLRMLGIETLGKVKPIVIETAGGEYVHLYMTQGKKDLGERQEALLIHPSEFEPIWFSRLLPDGKWKLSGKPDEYEGLATVKKGLLSPKQYDWWVKDAERFGIKAEQELDTRKFQLLPILANAGLKIR